MLFSLFSLTDLLRIWGFLVLYRNFQVKAHTRCLLVRQKYNPCCQMCEFLLLNKYASCINGNATLLLCRIPFPYKLALSRKSANTCMKFIKIECNCQNRMQIQALLLEEGKDEKAKWKTDLRIIYESGMDRMGLLPNITCFTVLPLTLENE